MNASPVGAARSPRDVITEDALFVDPSLIGLPLARPWRRAAAMAIDGLLVTILTQAPSVLFGLAVAYVLFRASGRRTVDGGYFRRSARLAFRFWGAVILFGFTIKGWNSASDRFQSGIASSFRASTPSEAPPAERPTAITGMDGIRAAADLVAFRQAGDAAEARRLGERAIRLLGAGGDERDELTEALVGIAASSPDRPWLAAVADSLVRETGATTAEPRVDADSLALAFGAALRAGDPEATERSRMALAGALARDTLRKLHAELAETRVERAELEGRVERLEQESEQRGFVSMVRGLAEDLGLGLGWFGLYFTATLALWQGRTPGKRLLGIRVIRLSGKPIGWWAAFERFGGYAAGLATGLLGFAQILWDRNRQAIHDKITETAVIVDR